MAFAMVVDQPGLTMDTYRKVLAEIGNVAPEGRRVHAVGATSDGIRFIDIWESEAHANRFAETILMPAFLAVLGAPPANTVFTPLELDELTLNS